MFGWLKNLFRKKSDKEVVEPYIYAGIYRPFERIVFEYWNGQDMVRADPIVLWKRIMDKSQTISVDLKVANSPMKDAPKCHTNLINTLSEVFEIQPFDEGGLTEIEVQELFDAFMEFCDEVKKNSGMPQMFSKGISRDTSKPSEAPSESSSIPNPPTSSSLDSGSTEKGSSTESATLPLSEQPSPPEKSMPEHLSSAT